MTYGELSVVVDNQSGSMYEIYDNVRRSLKSIISNSFQLLFLHNVVVMINYFSMTSLFPQNNEKINSPTNTLDNFCIIGFNCIDISFYLFLFDLPYCAILSKRNGWFRFFDFVWSHFSLSTPCICPYVIIIYSNYSKYEFLKN